MGGQSKNETDFSQQQNGITSMLQQQNDSQNGSSSASVNPWSTALPTVNGILSQLNPLIANSGLNANQQSGVNQLAANAANGNQFAGQIGDVAGNLFAGGGATQQSGAVQGGLDDLKARLGGQADPNYSSLNDPRLRAALDQIQSDVGNSVNGQFAAAGRDLSGANQMAYGRGVSAAQAPLILNQFNQDRTTQQNAAGTLYNAQNTTSGQLSGMTQQGVVNQGAGITAAGQAFDASNAGANALLNAGNLEQQLPAQQLGMLANIGIPIAGLGKTSTGETSQIGNTSSSANGTSSMTGSGTQTTTKTPSLLETLQGLVGIGTGLFGTGKPGAGGGLARGVTSWL